MFEAIRGVNNATPQLLSGGDITPGALPVRPGLVHQWLRRRQRAREIGVRMALGADPMIALRTE